MLSATVSRAAWENTLWAGWVRAGAGLWWKPHLAVWCGAKTVTAGLGPVTAPTFNTGYRFLQLQWRNNPRPDTWGWLGRSLPCSKASQLLKAELVQHCCSRAVELVMPMAMSTRVMVICSHWNAPATPVDEIFFLTSLSLSTWEFLRSGICCLSQHHCWDKSQLHAECDQVVYRNRIPLSCLVGCA